MRYELLPIREWSKVEDVFVEYGGLLPSPALSAIAAAKHGNEIVGFHCLQPVLHVEPIWIRPDFRGRVKFRPLLDVLKRELPQNQAFYAFAPNELIERMCAHCQLEKMPYSVWKGVA